MPPCTWSSTHRLGHYISFTDYWVSLLSAGMTYKLIDYATAHAHIYNIFLQLYALVRESKLGPRFSQLFGGGWPHTSCAKKGQANLLSALNQGKFAHMLCSAHVLNWLVQQFLVRLGTLITRMSCSRPEECAALWALISWYWVPAQIIRTNPNYSEVYSEVVANVRTLSTFGGPACVLSGSGTECFPNPIPSCGS